MTKKKFNKIVILGNSEKFILGIKKKYDYDNLKIIPWRKIKDYISSINEKYDLIFVCGFDFSLYSRNLEYFTNENVTNPIKLIKKISKETTQIVYINTQNLNKKKYTFSRYKFAKQELACQISQNFKKFAILKTDLIVDKNKISIKSNYVSKIIFLILVKIKLIKTIEVEKIFTEIDNLLVSGNCQSQENILGYFLKIPRTQFIDRFLRLLLG